MRRRLSLRQEADAGATEAPGGQDGANRPREAGRAFHPATDSLPDTYQAVISERFAFKPDATYLQAQNLLNRMRADEEALLLLM
jgi:hypothetical protein